MLLRRITNHLKQQNWFAVGVEIVIVLVGVFLGIQAANWNNEREQRQDERQILKRLSDETAVLLSAVREEKDLLQSRADKLTAVQPVIYSLEEARPLSGAECEAIALSHIYRLGSDELPVLNELIGTGRFDRLRSEGLRQELREYILFRDRLRSSHAERTNEIYRLTNRHPDAISVTSVPREADYAGDWTWLSAEGYRWEPSCNVEYMRSSKSFLNDFFDNSGRNGSVLTSYAEREAMLISLQEKLDELLES